MKREAGFTKWMLRFERDEIISHPLYRRRARADLTWREWVDRAILYTIVSALFPFLLIWSLDAMGYGWPMMTLALAALSLTIFLLFEVRKQSEFHRLREGGILRDLCLAGLGPAQTAAAYHFGWKSAYMPAVISALGATIIAAVLFGHLGLIITVVGSLILWVVLYFLICVRSRYRETMQRPVRRRDTRG